MSTIHRLVNQQLAYAQFHLREYQNSDPFAKRCHLQAALLQTSLGLQAYCAELLAGASQPSPVIPTARVSMQILFQDAQTQLRHNNRESADINELVLLASGPSWLTHLLQRIDVGLTKEAAGNQSTMLRHTTLNETITPDLISHVASDSEPFETFTDEIVALQALIQRQRDDKAEY